MNSSYLYLGGIAGLWLAGVVRYWALVLQQNNTAIAITLAVVSMLLFFTLIGVIVLLVVQNRQQLHQPRPDFGSGMYPTTRPTLHNIHGYRKLFLAIEEGLNREEIVDLAWKLDVQLDIGDAVPKSVYLREVFLALERRGEVGLLYMLVGSEEAYQHIQDLIL